MKINLKNKNSTVYERTPGKTHFVNNEEFFRELVERRDLVIAALAEGKEKPPVSDSIGRKLFMIAEALSRRHYFNGYSYREDMVQTGLVDCVRYIDSFDPEKGSRPFSYYNQICAFAFIRFITSEKKQTYIKHNIIMNLGTFLEDLQIDSHDADQEFKNHITDLLMQSSNPGLDRLFAKKEKVKENIPSIDTEFSDAESPFVEELMGDVEYDISE